MKIIDLSYTIENEMSVYPGDQSVIVEQIRFLEQDYFNSYSITITAHAGTHLDGPMHMTNSPSFSDEIELQQLIGKGRIIKVTESQIVLNEQFDSILSGEIVFFHTGAQKDYGTSKYYEDHPVITEEVIDYLIEKGVKIIGIDAPSIERDPYKLHPKWFKAGGLIVENLRNLEEVPQLNGFEVFIIPLKVKADSAPARVFVTS